jgi:hypothetical protein
MKYILITLISISVLACSPSKTRRIDRAIVDPKFDSTFVYGSAIVGDNNELWIEFENISSNERVTYYKLWADNRIYKEHIFVLNVPSGKWKINFTAVNRSGSGYRKSEVNKIFEVKIGKGYFIGKFDAINNPSKGMNEPSKNKLNQKEEVDLFFKNEHEHFNPDITELAVYVDK